MIRLISDICTNEIGEELEAKKNIGYMLPSKPRKMVGDFKAED